jgi:hypothetical protein
MSSFNESKVATLDNREVIIFKALNEFIQDLFSFYGEKYHPLALYARLLEKTTFNHSESIRKHINVFHTFCTQHSDNILNKSYQDTDKIEYSVKIYIPIGEIYNESDVDTKSTISNHILTIYGLVHPDQSLKKKIVNVLEENTSLEKGSNEMKFLSDTITKVEGQLTTGENDPMKAFSSVLNSGIITDLMGSMNNGLSNGQLDISKLMGVVTSILGTMQDPKSSLN